MAVVAVAAFLPWVSVLGLSVSGINGDGQITLVCALAGLLAYVLARGRRRLLLTIWSIGAALSVLVGVYDMSSVSAIGLYLTLLGGIGWAIATVWEFRSSPENSQPQPQLDDRIACPDCAELVPSTARLCRYCGHILRPDPGSASDESAA